MNLEIFKDTDGQWVLNLNNPDGVANDASQVLFKNANPLVVRAVGDLVTRAYRTGREDLQREIRILLNVAPR